MLRVAALRRWSLVGAGLPASAPSRPLLLRPLLLPRTLPSSPGLARVGLVPRLSQRGLVVRPTTPTSGPAVRVAVGGRPAVLAAPPAGAAAATGASLLRRRLALASALLAGAAGTVALLRFPADTVPAAAIVEPPQPTDFLHPLASTPLHHQAFVVAKRCFWLSVLFVPCATLGLLAHVSNNPSVRDAFLSTLVKAFELAGCGFQKFGQWMSMRPDMFPRDIVEAMAKLRQDAPVHSFAHTRAMVRQSFGAEIEEIFESFEEKPVASGTMAQVHRGVLRAEFALPGQDREVAIKIRHPSVLEETFIDVDLIFSFLSHARILAVPFDKTSFMETLQKQLNFRWEGYALAQFARNFRDEVQRGEVAFPRVQTNLLSESVLVESWVAGGTVAEFFAEVGGGFKELAADVSAAFKQQRAEMADQIFGVCMKMFLRDNLMHGDLHGGNVLYNKDRHVISVLDAGHTTSLERDSTAQFGKFMTGMCYGDPEVVADSLIAFSATPRERIDEAGLRRDVRNACARWVTPQGTAPDGGPVSVGDLMGEILFKLHSNHVTLRSDVAVSLVSIAVSEGLIRQLDPSFDMNRKALPYIAKYAAARAASV